VAKKSRTPPPPRRPVQAPQRRTAPSSPADRRKVLFLFAFAAAGLVALAIVIGVIAFAGGGGGSSNEVNDTQVTATMRAAGCTYRSVKPANFRPNHLDMPTLTTKPNWNTFPPAGGVHFGQWAVWGFHDEGPVNPRMIVHNEEHGGVVLWWGPQTPASEVDKLREFYTSDPVGVVATEILPFEGKTLGSKVAITAWTGDPKKYFKNGYLGTAHVAVCPTFNEHAFTTFRDAFIGKSVEGIPRSANQPGT
jgi:hypothetical protein